MANYFTDCKNLEELRKEYLRLIKKYHPDLLTNQDEFEKNNQLCSEINNEYDSIMKTFFKGNTLPKDYSKYNDVVDENKEAKSILDEIVNKLNSLNLDYNFYNSNVGVRWWEEEIEIEKNNAIKLFIHQCYAKNIIGEKFIKLYKLCGCNAEKMRRVVLFLSTGALSDKDIHDNLEMDKPVEFFSDYLFVENLPDYDSFLVLSNENTKKETINAWIRLCQIQRDNFNDKFLDTNVKKLP